MWDLPSINRETISCQKKAFWSLSLGVASRIQARIISTLSTISDFFLPILSSKIPDSKPPRGADRAFTDANQEACESFRCTGSVVSFSWCRVAVGMARVIPVEKTPTLARITAITCRRTALVCSPGGGVFSGRSSPETILACLPLDSLPFWLRFRCCSSILFVAGQNVAYLSWKRGKLSMRNFLNSFTPAICWHSHGGKTLPAQITGPKRIIMAHALTKANANLPRNAVVAGKANKQFIIFDYSFVACLLHKA